MKCKLCSCLGFSCDLDEGILAVSVVCGMSPDLLPADYTGGDQDRARLDCEDISVLVHMYGMAIVKDLFQTCCYKKHTESNYIDRTSGRYSSNNID